MAKFFGNVGFSLTKEIRPGVYRKDEVEEHPYYGDIIEPYLNHQAADKPVDDLKLSNEISIIADAFAALNASNIVYVNYLGANWKVVGVQMKYPRLKLTLGGVYNGRTAEECD